MIVAAGAADTQAEKGLAQVVDGVIDGQVEFRIARPEPSREGEITSRNDVLVLFGFSLRGHEVARDLLSDELIIRLVFVE